MYRRKQLVPSLAAFLPGNRNYSVKKASKEVRYEEVGANFYAKNIGSHYGKWYTILKKHPELKTLKVKDVLNSKNALSKFNFTVDDIMNKPMILYTNEVTIENRYIVLKECGFENITISLLYKFVAAMNRSVVALKSMNYISYDTDVVRRLQGTFKDIELRVDADCGCNEGLELKNLRQLILNRYFQQRLGASNSELEKLWKTYARLRHRSFISVQNVIGILLNELNFSRERIIKNGYLLYGDADNIKRIMKEIPTIAGQDIKELLYKRPKIMMTSCDALRQTLQHIKKYGIPEEGVLRCLEILTLGPDTVLERLKDLNEIEEFQVLSSNPRVLRLVHYQNKARLRLDYLNQLKVRCASLHILSCGSEAFEKFARDGSDKTKGRDIVVYLSNIMNKSENDIRNLLSRHPNWCHIPVLHVKQCYEFLKRKDFNNEEMYKNLHILIYPIKRIEQKLDQIKKENFLGQFKSDGIKDATLSGNEKLNLVLYLIESEFHFTGDGIWTEQHTQHVENFNNLLPDFPESPTKIYKYGEKPTTPSASMNNAEM